MTRGASLARGALAIVLLALAGEAGAATDLLSLPAFRSSASEQGTEYSVSLQILFLMTALTLLPSLLITMTAFTRIIVVFAILRQAIGLQQTPSNQILVGLALFLTLFVMMPVFERINANALQPYLAEQVTSTEAVERAVAPLREFMLAQTREADLDTFARIAVVEADTAAAVPLHVLVPAFITSELRTAFQIGFMLFIPFLVIDMVVASVLMSMGMMMLSPLIISLPFKIMLFVMVDGWTLVVGTIATSFGAGP